MELLKEYFEVADDVSLEDVDKVVGGDYQRITLENAEEMLGRLVVAGEEFFEDVSSMEALLLSESGVSLEARNEIVAKIKDYSAIFGVGDTGVSLESIEDDELFVEVSLETLTDFTGRFVQVYANLFKGTYDAAIGALTSSKTSAEKLRKRLLKAKTIWDGKKNNLDSRNVVSSYAGQDIFYAFFRDGKMQREPLKVLEEDFKITNYVLGDFQKDVSDYAKKLSSIIASGKYGSEKDFLGSVIGPIGRLGNVSDLFNQSYVTNNPILLTNRNWKYKKKEKEPKVKGEGKEISFYVKTATERKLVINEDFFNSLSDASKVVYHDIKYPTSDVDKIITVLIKYCDAVISHTDNSNRLMGPHKEVVAQFKRLKGNKGMDVGKNGKALLGSLTRLAKYVMDYQITPAKHEISRVNFIVSRASIYITRVVKRTK